MRIAVFGLGYVGSVTAACLANLGHRVTGVDVAESKVEAMGRGHSPVEEPGLQELISEGITSGALQVTTDHQSAVVETDAAFVCVGTPTGPDGTTQTEHLRRVAQDIAVTVRMAGHTRYPVLVRSTCLPDSHREISGLLDRESRGRICYVTHPEFLREGTAVSDFMSPPMVVFGADTSVPDDLFERLYHGIDGQLVTLPLAEASLLKYASNLFHALKITFANEMAQFSESFGADGRLVMDAFQRDRVLNISSKYLKPGMPFGGSCLPKDVHAAASHAEARGRELPLVSSLLPSNNTQLDRVSERIAGGGYRKAAILGLAFKQDTDDIRHSPLVEVARRLVDYGIPVGVWDRRVRVEKLVGANRAYMEERLPELPELLHPSADVLLKEVDAVLIGQSLSGDDIRRLPLTEAHTVYDLAGALEPSDVPGRYHGLYW